LHRAFEVVEPVGGQLQRSADRAPGVVDQEVDALEVAADLVGQQVDRVEVG
jgi:hypothetical protein